MNETHSIPAFIGDYRIEERLGAGGMGEVYRAWDTHLERAVAIKLIRADQSAAPNAQERFRREAQAIARLDHPSIVRIHHIQKWGEHHCIVMELVEGETLFASIARGLLPIERAVLLLRQIAEGLAAAHGQEIIHRDLKSTNVMVTPENDVKVLDFGLAKRLSGDTVSTPGVVVGTLHTMSPEQAQGELVDTRADLFSLGALAYELLTGTAPFRGGNARETYARVVGQRPPSVRELRPEIPAELSTLVDRLLEKDPNQRPQRAEEVTEALVQWLDTAPSNSTATQRSGSPREDLAQTPTVPPAFGRPSSILAPRSVFKHWRWTAALAVIAFLTLTVYLTVPWARDRPPMTVLVLGFAADEPRDGETWLSTALSDLLADELRGHRQIRVLTSEQATRIRRFHGLANESSKRELADLAASLPSTLADAIVTGAWKASGDTLEVQVALRKTRTGRSDSANLIGSVGNLFPMNRELAAELAALLGVGRPTPEETDVFTAAWPKKTAVLRLFAEGLTAWRNEELSTAKERFESALDLEPDNPELHRNHALIWLSRGYRLKAEQAARRAHDLARPLGSDAGRRTLATAHEVLRDWGMAAETYGELFERHPDELIFGIRRAETRWLAGPLEEAQKNLEALRGVAGAPTLGFIDLAEAHVHQEWGDLELARRLTLRAVAAGQAHGQAHLEAQSRYLEASILEGLDDYEGAMVALSQAQGLFERVGDFGGALNTSLEKAIVLAKQGRPRKALETFEIYRRFYAGRGDEVLAAIGAVNLGSVLSELGRLEEARGALERAVQVFTKRGVRDRLAEALVNLAVVDQKDGSLDAARRANEQALAIFRELEDAANTALVLANLGEILHWNGDLTQADDHYREALEIDRGLHSQVGELFDLGQLGEIAILRADMTTARTHLEASLELAKKTKAPDALAEVQLRLAWLELEESNAGAAERLTRTAQALFLEAGLEDAAARAKIVQARSLMQRPIPELEQAHGLSTQISLTAVDSEDYRVRFGAAILEAELEAQRSTDPLGALRKLESLAVEIEAKGHVLDAWEVRLILGELETELGDKEAGQARLETVRAEAQARGWALFERRAARRLGK